MKQALRRKQLELYDSGLLPEKMRDRRAAQHNLTIYEMVRDKKVYPLETYLDAADLALSRNAKNLDTFLKRMSNNDEGIRWWAIVGIHLLGDDAVPVVRVLKDALRDESHEVRTMAAWTLVKLGQKDEALTCLENLLFDGSQCRSMVHNVLDWMGEPAFPLVKKYMDEGGSKKGRYGISILCRIAELQGW